LILNEKDFNEEDIKLLSLVDIFEPLSEEEIEAINWRHLSTRVGKGEVFFTPMDLAETLFVLKSGRVRIFKRTPRGRELTLAIVESGTVFGEMALTGQRLRNAFAEGLEPSEIAALCRADVERLILEKPQVGLQLIHLLSERLVDYERRLEDLSFKEVPARLASLIYLLIHSQGVRGKKGYKIPTRYTHQQLGSMIAANREAITRAIARLREASVVETKKRYIYVKDLESLERACQDDFFQKKPQQRS
jgi:CRP/FNR family transcriptional regulator